MTDAEVEQKFFSQSAAVLNPGRAHALVKRLWTVEDSDVCDLFPLMRVVET